MLAFHLDLKAVQYRLDYLGLLFPRLANAGYTHIFVEFEDKVALESTCGAAWCEAWSKETFAGVLAGIRDAGMVAIPLIQTLGHLEFLLSHSRYHPLRESHSSAYMLCPSKPQSIDFIFRYMDEVGELFNNPPFIHLGADEAWDLGSCPQCAAHVATSSKGHLMLNHMATLFDHALSRGSRPIAWADMVLRHSHVVDQFSRDAVWMDWDYWTQDTGPHEVRDWPSGSHGGPEMLTAEFLASDIGRFATSSDGAFRPWFYTDYLIEKGFDVIIAPATRCGGDHVFAPHIKHAGNVMSAVLRMAQSPRPLGMLVTSWALRLNHIEMQWPAIHIPRLAGVHSAEQWSTLQMPIAQEAFGRAVPDFFLAWERLSPSFNLAQSVHSIENAIHYYGQQDSIPYLFDRLAKQDDLENEYALIERLLPGYKQADAILDTITHSTATPNLCLMFWRFAAKAITARAEETRLFLDARTNTPNRHQASEYLLRLEDYQDEYRQLLMQTCTPASVERELAMIFATSWRHLARLAADPIN